MIFLRKFILHREYYNHHIITILIISFISILLTCINCIMYRLNNNTSDNFKQKNKKCRNFYFNIINFFK